jgi:glucose/mannose-6-phosphate isomerase
MSDLLHDEINYVPEVQGDTVSTATIVCGGMGGSALPALMLRFLDVPQEVVVHRDYGLPFPISAEAACIALSYSGNTEETLSFAREAFEKGHSLAIVTSGGALLEFANEHHLSHVVVPPNLQPRDAVLATTKALVALIGAEHLLAQLSDVNFSGDEAEHDGEALSVLLKGAVPIFYSSTRNSVLSYIAKIQCNETAKIPAFSNVFPELNHNELQGFDTGESAHILTQPFITVFMRDSTDDEHIQHRMELTEQLLRDKGVRTTYVSLKGDSRAQKFITTWWFLRTVAHALAKEYAVDPDATPLIESFKKSL